MPFVYSDDAQSNLRRSIARDRLSSYVSDCNGDLCKAIQLYERNTLFSQTLYGVLQPLEIAFRNSIHQVMTGHTGHADWYERAPMRTRELESVHEAKANIIRWNNAVTSSRVVAELTFGFWTKLIGREYEKTLWVPHLHRAFPHLRKPDRLKVFSRFDSIKQLRNRIAHHERIISRDLAKDYAEIIETIGWICPTTACWVRSTNSFPIEHSR
jgi:Abi-like protein